MHTPCTVHASPDTSSTATPIPWCNVVHYAIACRTIWAQQRLISCWLVLFASAVRMRILTRDQVYIYSTCTGAAAAPNPTVEGLSWRRLLHLCTCCCTSPWRHVGLARPPTLALCALFACACERTLLRMPMMARSATITTARHKHCPTQALPPQLRTPSMGASDLAWHIRRTRQKYTQPAWFGVRCLRKRNDATLCASTHSHIAGICSLPEELAARCIALRRLQGLPGAPSQRLRRVAWFRSEACMPRRASCHDP